MSIFPEARPTWQEDKRRAGDRRTLGRERRCDGDGGPHRVARLPQPWGYRSRVSRTLC